MRKSHLPGSVPNKPCLVDQFLVCVYGGGHGRIRASPRRCRFPCPRNLPKPKPTPPCEPQHPGGFNAAAGFLWVLAWGGQVRQPRRNSPPPSSRDYCPRSIAASPVQSKLFIVHRQCCGARYLPDDAPRRPQSAGRPLKHWPTPDLQPLSPNDSALACHPISLHPPTLTSVSPTTMSSDEKPASSHLDQDPEKIGHGRCWDRAYQRECQPG